MPYKSRYHAVAGGISSVAKAAMYKLLQTTISNMSNSKPGLPKSTALRKRSRFGRPKKSYRSARPRNERIQGGQGLQVRFTKRRPLRGRARLISRMSALNNLTANAYGSLTSADGRQTHTSMDIGTVADLQAIFNTTGISNTTKEFLFRSGDLDVVLSNPTNTTIYVAAYFLRPHRDYNASATVGPPPVPGDAAQTWQNGMTAQGMTNGDLIVGNKPFDSEMFTKFWHSEYVKRVMLGPGDSVKLHYDWSPNVVYSLQEASVAGYTHFKALTRTIMINAWGQPVDDDTGIVTTAPVSLDYIITRNYTWQWSTDYTTTSTLLGSGLPTGTANLEVMADTGIAQVLADA